MATINIGLLSIPVYLFNIRQNSYIKKKHISEKFFRYRCTKKMEHMKKSSKINLLKYKLISNEIIEIDYFEKKAKKKLVVKIMTKVSI